MRTTGAARRSIMSSAGPSPPPPGNRYSDALAAPRQTMIAMPRTRLMTGVKGYARDHFNQVVHEHRSIAAAIVDGEETAASAAMRSHLANSRRRLRTARLSGTTPGTLQPSSSLRYQAMRNTCWTCIAVLE